MSDPYPVKVVVTGPFGAGKTTFVRSVAESGLVGTETAVSDETAALKAFTTVSLDFGALDLDDPTGTGLTKHVALFGTPGQARYDFMWRVVAEGMRVFIVLVDASRRQSRDEALLILRAFRLISPDAPYLVAVNRWSADEDLDRLLLDLGMTGAERHLVLRADIRRPEDGNRLLQHALQLVRPRQEAWDDERHEWDAELADAAADL